MQQRLWCMLLSAIDWTTIQQPTGWCQQPIATKAPSHPEWCCLSFTGARRSEHMTPILRDLHWLPVRRRITFKTAVLVYKCLHDMASQYLQTYCEPTSTVASRRLRSTHSGRLTVPCTRANYRDRSFAVQGPRVWNSLPAALRAPDITLTTFRNKLKTFLFNM